MVFVNIKALFSLLNGTVTTLLFKRSIISSTMLMVRQFQKFKKAPSKEIFSF